MLSALSLGNRLGILSLGISAMPWIYDMGAAKWLPNGPYSRIVFGPVAILAGTALVGAAAGRGSKWWLIALIVPFAGMMMIMTAYI